MLYDAFYQSLDYLVTIIPVMVIGVVAAEFLVEMGWIHKIGFIVSPLTRFAHLHEECSVSFITAFGSPAASNSMLKKLYDDGRIERKELIVASLINSFPSIIMHWRTLLPVFIPLLGMAGMIYLGILTFVGLLRTFVIVLIGHFLLEKKQYIPEKSVYQPPLVLNAFKTSIEKSRKTIFRIITMTIPVTILVFVLLDAGFFEVLADFLKEHAVFIPVPGEALPIIAAQFTANIAAYTIAGNLLSAGILNTKEIVLSLLVGKILSSIMSIRILIPYYVGIFGSKLGTQIMVYSAILREGILVVAAVILAIFW
ncbi:MAG: nucleoside recognition domain-containing protein [Candidatus Methanoperedens sp.]|nr:nucleoside recognition domain-containing protein [Candidatus Methanoperedens sp.]